MPFSVTLTLVHGQRSTEIKKLVKCYIFSTCEEGGQHMPSILFSDQSKKDNHYLRTVACSKDLNMTAKDPVNSSSQQMADGAIAREQVSSTRPLLLLGLIFFLSLAALGLVYISFPKLDE